MSETEATVEQPTTKAGQRILDEWLMLRPDYPPNTARVRDMIVECEHEARAASQERPSIDVERHENPDVTRALSFLEREGIGSIEKSLLRYGRHEEGCPEEHNDPPWPSCECGWADTLARLSGPVGESGNGDE